MNDLTHDEIEASGLAARYVARRLHGAEREAFEAHLLECTLCQEEVRLGVAVAATFRRTQPQRRRWPALAGLAAAAILAFIFWPRSQAALRELGSVGDPPPYDAVEVRGVEISEAESLFVVGTARYRARDWDGAVSAFEAARRKGLVDPAISFLLGVSRLMTGDAKGAAADLEGAGAPIGGPYAEEAHYYEAKARLQLGEGTRALALLRATPGAAATALADSVEALLSR